MQCGSGDAVEAAGGVAFQVEGGSIQPRWFERHLDPSQVFLVPPHCPRAGVVATASGSDLFLPRPVPAGPGHDEKVARPDLAERGRPDCDDRGGPSGAVAYVGGILVAVPMVVFAVNRLLTRYSGR
jgi:hypothetical protein